MRILIIGALFVMPLFAGIMERAHTAVPEILRISDRRSKATCSIRAGIADGNRRAEAGATNHVRVAYLPSNRPHLSGFALIRRWPLGRPPHLHARWDGP